jgi:threonine dehydratase
VREPVLPTALTLADIRKAAMALEPFIRRTPCLTLSPEDSFAVFGLSAQIVFKLELLQVSGSFKVRGALSSILALSAEQRARGVTAVSAGNHAVAVAFAARALGTHAKLVMLKSANPLRIQLAKQYGAEVELADDGAHGFVLVQAIEKNEGRYFVHPFEGPGAVLGSATLGLEWSEQAPHLDAIIVAVGGGGLIAGIGSAFAAQRASTAIYGVEPSGAAGLSLSMAAGAPTTLAQVHTIADSLAPPIITPYTFDLCRRHVDQITLVSDDEMRLAMGLLFTGLKLGVEPAGAAALAAARGKLLSRIEGRRVGILVCGANIDIPTFAQQARTA